MIRDSNVLMTATLIPVSRLLATDQPQLFHDPPAASAPSGSLRVAIVAMLLCSGRAVADAMQFKYLAA